MTAVRRWRPAALVALVGLALAGCSNVRGVAATRDALEEVGYRDVEVSFRSGAGIDLVRVEAVPVDGSAPDQQRVEVAAGAVWRSLPMRFDRLQLAISGPGFTIGAVYGYDDLAALFGARAHGLDYRQVGDQVVAGGLKLVVLLSIGALLSVALVVGLALFSLRNVRRRRSAARGEAGQGEGDGSFPEEETSPTAGASAADGPAIPS